MLLLLYLRRLQNDARHSLPSGSKNIVVAAVWFRNKILIASSGTLLARIRPQILLFC